MAGTDRKRPRIAEGPAVILVEPQLGENIGAAARAMLNCGLNDLRLVRPRDPWPNERAVAMASGADSVLDSAVLYDRIEDATAKLRHVYATTTRDRFMVKRVLTPRAASAEMRGFMAAGEACGILFGPERAGLTSDQVALSDTIITAPLNPGFASLNLAQAVLLVGYEWLAAADETPPEQHPTGRSRPAEQEEYLRFFSHLEEELEINGFLHNKEARPTMLRNLRALFLRAQCTEQELRTLHGVITALAGPRQRAPKKADES